MKRPRKNREVYAFKVEDVFPPDDALGIDLLRLMAFDGDLSFIEEFMRSARTLPVRSDAKQVAASRWFFLQRLLSAGAAELVNILHKLKKQRQFGELRGALDPAGRDALAKLLSIPRNRGHPFYGIWSMARNNAAFHFDHDAFAGAVRRLGDRFSTTEAAESSFIVERIPGRGRRIYYSFADQVATEATYGLPHSKPGDRPSNYGALKAAIDLHAALSEFLDSAFEAYQTIRRIPQAAIRRRTEGPR